MPTVPKSMLDPTAVAEGEPGLLQSKDTQPDASSILMAASVMKGLGRIGHMPGLRRPKASKSTGQTRAMLK